MAEKKWEVIEGDGGGEDVVEGFHDDAPVSVTKRESALLPLTVLLSMRWQDNPKLHQDALIEFSVNQYGFNDPLGVCLEYGLVCTGHGRLGVLSRMFDAQLPPPRNIDVDESGMWLVPCELLMFVNKTDALRYALLHNRSATSKLDGLDYDSTRLNRALRAAASGTDQFALPGFTDGEIGTAFIQDIAEVPPLPVFDAAMIAPSLFDASRLPDTPGYQAEQVTQSFVIMITAPSYEQMLRMLRAITYGERVMLPEVARFCSVEGTKYLDQWEARNLSAQQRDGFAEQDKKRAALPADVLPGQITLAGDVVTDKNVYGTVQMLPGMEAQPVPQTVPPGWSDLVASMSEGALSPVQQEAMNPENLLAMAVPTQASEPKWRSGLCPTCGGSGYTGFRILTGTPRQKVICVECGGAGDRETWLKTISGEEWN